MADIDLDKAKRLAAWVDWALAETRRKTGPQLAQSALEATRQPRRDGTRVDGRARR